MHKVPSPAAPAPLLAHLVAALAPVPRGRVKEWLRAGRVTVNGVAVTRHDHPVTPADAVAVGPAAVPDALGGVRVVHEDARLVVVDKPAGLLTVATDAEKLDTLFARASRHFERRRGGRVFVVHRLDRDTSGLVLLARTPDERDRLQAGWPGVRKTYLAVVHGLPVMANGFVENHLREDPNLRVRAVPAGSPGAKAARSEYRVRATCGRLALVEVDLLTGRKHQIRVHLAGIGCPVVGDRVYGRGADPAGRLGLHAWRLAVPAADGGVVEAESPLPAELARLVPP